MSTQTIDYDALAQQHGAVAGDVDYDALAKQHGAVGDEKPEGIDNVIPLTSYGNAFGSGVQSIVRGFRDTAKGMWDTLGAPPKDKTEAAMFTLGGPTLVPVYRTLVGAGHSIKEATQIASAVHDINNSSDPAGTYAKVLQETAGQGAAQALTALATEGVIKVAPKVVEAGSAAAGKVADTVRNITPKHVAAGVGGTAGAYGGAHIPGFGGAGGVTGAAIGAERGAALAERLLGERANVPLFPKKTPIPPTVPGAGAAEDLEGVSSPQTEAAGEVPPEAQPVETASPEPAPPAAPPELPAGFQSVAQAPPGSANNPFQAPPQVEAPPAVALPQESLPVAAAPQTEAAPAKLDQLLSDALGGKKLEPNVPLKNQTAVTPTTKPAAAAAKSEIPAGFTPVKSSVLKAYKYNSATQEFDGITNTGQVYRHAEVTPDQFQKFESADSKGKAWNELRNNATPLGKVNNGVLQPRIKPRSIVMDENGRPEFSDVIEAKQAGQTTGQTAAQPEPKAAPEAASEETKESTEKPGEEDLTSLMEQSLDQLKVPEGGVSTSVDPAALTKRWGVDPESLTNGREQTRGMTPEQTEAYINKLAESYKNGRPVEPVMETRDAENNLIDADGRARAIAAQRAGIKRIPIIVRRLRAPVKQ